MRERSRLATEASALALILVLSFDSAAGHLATPAAASWPSSDFLKTPQSLCFSCFGPSAAKLRHSWATSQTASRRPAFLPRSTRAHAAVCNGIIMGRDEADTQPTLIWDVMSTLVYDPFFVEVPEFFGMPLKQLYKEKDSQIWTDFEKGKCTQQDLFDRFFLDKREFDGNGLVQMINDRYEWLPGMEELMSELCGEGRRMHIMSNYPVWWNNIENKLKLSRYAEWSFVSCENGVRKPDAQAFQIVQKALALEGGRCLLIDDSLANVDGAREQGWDAILFTGAEDCRQELLARGFLGRNEAA